MNVSASPAAIGLPILVENYVTLSADTLPSLLQCYAEHAHFKDPFNDVVGRKDIERIFRHMFAALNQPTFTVLGSFPGEREAMLRWEFQFDKGGRSYAIPGSTAVAFDYDGLVIDHVDYWDPTETVWSRVPLVGAPVRWLRRQFSSSNFQVHGNL